MQNMKERQKINIRKLKETHRYREQISGYQQEEKREKDKTGFLAQEIQTTMYKINKIHGYIVEHVIYIFNIL